MVSQHTWMWPGKDEKQAATQDTVTVPVLVGIAAVILTVAVLYLLHRRPSIAGRTGTHTTLEGGKLVRRSARCFFYVIKRFDVLLPLAQEQFPY